MYSSARFLSKIQTPSEATAEEKCDEKENGIMVKNDYWYMALG